MQVHMPSMIRHLQESRLTESGSETAAAAAWQPGGAVPAAENSPEPLLLLLRVAQGLYQAACGSKFSNLSPDAAAGPLHDHSAAMIPYLSKRAMNRSSSIGAAAAAARPDVTSLQLKYMLLPLLLLLMMMMMTTTLL